MKAEAKQADPLLPDRQKAAVGKSRVKPGATVTRLPVRPTPPKKPVVTPQRPQQQTQRRMAPVNAQTLSKPPVAARRPTDALERQKMRRGGTNLDTTPRNREAKKRKISVPPPPRPKVGGGPFPADVDEQYSMKKFMADSESVVSFSIATTTLEQADPSSMERLVTELAKDVAAAIDVDKLNQFTTDETSDQPPRSWREFPLDTDGPQHLKTDNKFDDFSRSPPRTPKPSSVRLEDTVDDGKVKDRVNTRETSNVKNEFTVPVQTEHATKDEIASTSAAKQDEFERAIGGAVRQEDKILGSGKDVDESLLCAKTKDADGELSASNQEKTQLMQSGKPSTESKEMIVQNKTEFDKVLKDGVEQTVHHTLYRDADVDDDGDESETAYKAEDWTKLDRDEDKLSSASLYDDHQTISDDDVEYDVDRTFDHRMTLSSEVPLSRVSDRDDGRRTLDHYRMTSSTEVPLSDKDDEWATLSVTSTLSNRNLTTPALLPRSSAPYPEDIRASAVREVNSLKYVEDGAREKELVKVINKEHKAEIIVDLVFDEADPDRVPVDEAVHPALNNEEEKAEVYWSGSDNEEEDELMQLEFRKEKDTDEVDSTIQTGDLSSVLTDPSQPVTSSVPRDFEELEHEESEVDDAGKMDEHLHGIVTSHEVTKDEVVADDSSKLFSNEQITKETAERVLSNPDLTNNTELVHGNDLADEDLVAVAISGHYLEREHGLPILTPLDREEEPEESLRGEGPALYQDEEAARVYPVGEDGLPDFAGAEYSLRIATEDAEEDVVVEGRGRQLYKPDDSAIGGTQKPARMDDEVSVLPEAADSEVWDDELYNAINPGLVAELRELKTGGAETETTSGPAKNQRGRCVEFSAGFCVCFD